MFERFTERSRQVVARAQEEARAHAAGAVTTDHLILGLLADEDGLAAHALGRCGLTPEAVKSKFERGDLTDDTADIPFTPEAKMCLEWSLREALSLGHNYVGTEHVLLGVLDKTRKDFGGRYGIDPEAVRRTVFEILGDRDSRGRSEHEWLLYRVSRDGAMELVRSVFFRLPFGTQPTDDDVYRAIERLGGILPVGSYRAYPADRYLAVSVRPQVVRQ